VRLTAQGERVFCDRRSKAQPNRAVIGA
jgi:hypothetical protein